jgi:sulfatase maturation enzyme AslB (radical SAM superfamily)
MTEDEFWIQPENSALGRWQKTISDVAKVDTFCALPWIHFATRPNGDMRLCCSSNASGAGNDHTVGLVKNEKGQPANFGRETPMSAWNNDYMRSVRSTMLEGKIPKSCTKCFIEESNGVSSKRVWETFSWMQEGVDIPELIKQTQDDGTIPENLVYLDLRLGHTCNLKCVMCSPHDSSKWVQEQKIMFPQYQSPALTSQMAWDQKEFNNKWHENPEFWKEMYNQIPNLKQVYFAGGEPLMIKEHKIFLEEIIRRGYADKILIRYNTNGLLLDNDIIDLWKRFKKVKVGFSLDGTDVRNHYIRYPSDWNKIENNLRLLDNTPDNIEGSIATAIQIFNIKHLPDFIKWKVNNKFKKINMSTALGGTLAGGGLVNMHLLYIPTFLSIQILSIQDKKEVRELFSELREWLWNNYTKDDDFWKHNPYGWKRWESVLTHMDAKDHSDLLPSFKEYVEKLDTYRKLNAGEVFPELKHLF